VSGGPRAWREVLTGLRSGGGAVDGDDARADQLAQQLMGEPDHADRVDCRAGGVNCAGHERRTLRVLASGRDGNLLQGPGDGHHLRQIFGINQETYPSPSARRSGRREAPGWSAHDARGSLRERLPPSAHVRSPVKHLGFRGRLLTILIAFALLPSLTVTVAWWATVRRALPLVGASGAWEATAASGSYALAAARELPLTPVQAQAIAAHEQALDTSLLNARRLRFIAARAAQAAAGVALLGMVVLAVVASRVAGHLSRNLSRPVAELVGWTERIAHGLPLPAGDGTRGAPEFQVLRERMRRMAAELELGRARAVEAERAATFRESARQVAHELKNPLTPIRFAVARLRRDAAPELAEIVEVLDVESRRLEEMARSFAQFGRLPEGPPSDVDLGELARYAARATVPDETPLTLEIEEGVPPVRGHLEPLNRALSNVLVNAVEACRHGGAIRVAVRRAAEVDGGVEVLVHDTGCGIAPDQVERIWDPYVTHKPGGTGLGLAIARQTIVAHAGQVAAESVPDQGTTIRFIIPIGGAAAPIGEST